MAPARGDAAMAPAGDGRGVTARVRGKDGWAVRGAILTVMDMTGRQAGHASADEEGAVASGSLPAGTYTAIITAPGYAPAARTAVIPASGNASLGVITVDRAAGVALPPAGRWTVDPVHSAITIFARHLGLARVRGRVTEFSGEIEIGEPVERSVVRARMQAASIDTGSSMRDDHLRSADFLNVSAYPVIEYTGTGVRPDGADRWTVDGELTLRGTTRPVPLHLTYLGSGPDPWGGTRAAFHAAAELNRHDFAVSWNQALPDGVVVGSVLQVELDIEAVHGELPVAG
jgi:polyisoprenoid-binding protein YceI